MISSRRQAILAALIFGFAWSSRIAGEEGKPSFRPAEATEVSDIFIPAPGQTNGTVVLNAVISEEGKPESVDVRREMEGLTGPATDAIKEWAFSPALLDGKPVRTRIAVAVTLHPYGPGANPVPLPRLLPQSDEAIQAAYQPPEVVEAAFPVYPNLVTVGGTVVLQVDLDERGEVGEMKVLKDLPPLTDNSKAAVANWRFRAATHNGRPVPSKIVLGFVFQPWSPAEN